MGEEKEPKREPLRNGEIPVLVVEGRTLPEVWEKSVLELWEKGTRIKTQYDREGDPPSVDSTLTMVVHEPFSEPRIHLRLPTGLEELEVYRQEVVGGLHDSWVGEQGWSYSYHDRLFHYPLGNGEYFNQIEKMIEQLAASPYTRRAQAITWVPELDADHHEPPCLQRIWCRIMENEKGELFLNINTDWRSRDAFQAAFMNIFAFTDLQRWMAEEISKRMERAVKVGRYTDKSDSYHIYGKDHVKFSLFLGGLAKRSFEQRTLTTQQAEPEFQAARRKIAAERANLRS